MLTNFIFSTKRYDEEAKRYSASQELSKIKDKLTTSPEYEPEPYKSFSGNYFKVIFNKNFRIILTRRDTKIGNVNVRIYVLLRIMNRGGKEYERFQLANTPESERDKITGKSSVDWDMYVSKIQEMINKPDPVVLKPSLTQAENNFISTPLNINHELFDVTLYETRNWINDIQEVGFNDFSNAASCIEDYIIEKLNGQEGWYIIEFKQKAILIYHQEQNWILDRIIERRENGDYRDLTKQKKPVDFRRGYPFDFLGDKDVWRIMEKDKKSNMVLSQQQVEIVSSEIQYPLFLTGRAGSGKSTILQYLFAEIVLRYLNTTKQFDDGLKIPVYLSYSSNLISDARNLCNTLFEKNNVYKKALQEYGILYKKDIEPIMNEMFFVFTDLLRDCIDKKQPGLSSKLFPNTDKYISFPNFNSLWNKKFGKIRDAAKKYGPSISWHVIRTYIKGWDSNKYMTPEEYENIGEKNQTVSIDTFRLIYEQVWENWYSKMEDTWDDQDIVRYCLENNFVDERFSAVFCDESQDFTRVEIDFILKLSSFSNRNLQNASEIQKLPFVFAGDEFQTLNPTGFSWASLSSYFTESLCNSTEQRINEVKIPAPIELSENYRSTEQVVKLANRIQLLRATRFGEYSKPQTPHFSEEGNSIYCISPLNKYTIQKLKDKQVILIVPAADGESVEDFINNSELKGQVEFDKGVPQDITILNPTQAKGLEYPNVAVYGFNCKAQYSSLRLDNLLKWFENNEEDAVTDIELKYQISNAYVAATRAGSNLYILDEFDEESFWAFAFSHEDPELDTKIRVLQERMISQLTDSQKQNWFEDELGWIEDMPEGIDITDENLSYLKSEEHKNDLENRAEALHDPKLMRRAACIHKSAGNKKDEARCKAKAYNFEEDYLHAAEWFEIAEDYKAAIENYWIQLNNTPNIGTITKIAELKDYSQNEKVNICLKCANPTVRSLKMAIDITLNVFTNNHSEHALSNAWQFVLNALLTKIQPKKKEGINDVSIIVKNLHKLMEFEIKLNMNKLASLAYGIGANKDAIKLWEDMEKSLRPKEYYKAKLEILKYPETIEFYEGTGEPNWMTELMQMYRRKSTVKLSDNQKRVVASVVNVIGQKDEFMTFLPFMLRYSNNYETSKNVLEDAERFGCDINKVVLTALFDTRFTDLSSWKKPKQKFVSSDASALFEAVEKIRNMRQDDFNNLIDRSLKSMNALDFYKQYNIYSRTPISKLVFLELGKRFESRDIFIDAIRYYEWARNQSDDPVFKRAMDIRWIACKERQAEYEKDSYKHEAYMKDALTKRQELGLSSDKKFPEVPNLIDEDWEEIFKFYVNVSNEEIVEKKKRERITTPKEQEETKEVERTILSKQELRYQDYSVIFFPNKGYVVVKDRENEYSIRIKDGDIPTGGDFYLKDTRVYVTEDNTMTPFALEKKEKNCIINIYEGEVFTGVSLTINMSN